MNWFAQIKEGGGERQNKILPTNKCEKIKPSQVSMITFPKKKCHSRHHTLMEIKLKEIF